MKVKLVAFDWSAPDWSNDTPIQTTDVAGKLR
jgi:hypothetical protein